MNAKTILPIILGIFLLSTVSAIGIDGIWEDGSKEMTIAFGQSIEFDAEFFTMHPPADISIIMYSLDDKDFEYEFENKTLTERDAYYTQHTVDNNVYSETGNYEIILSGSDQVDKNSDTLTLKIVPAGADATKPVIEILAPEQGKTYSSVKYLHYKITDENLDFCEYSVDDGEKTEFECVSGEQGTIEINAVNRENTWTIYAEDEYGNKNEKSVTFTIDPSAEDTTPPSITIVSPEDEKYDKDEITFRIITDEELERAWFVFDNGNETDMENPSNNIFTYTMQDISDGVHTITFYAKDLAGNEANKTISFEVDTTEDEDSDGTGETEDDDYYDEEYENQFDDPTIIDLGEEEVKDEDKIPSSLWVWILIIAIIIVVILIILVRLL